MLGAHKKKKKKCYSKQWVNRHLHFWHPLQQEQKQPQKCFSSLSKQQVRLFGNVCCQDTAQLAVTVIHKTFFFYLSGLLSAYNLNSLLTHLCNIVQSNATAIKSSFSSESCGVDQWGYSRWIMEPLLTLSSPPLTQQKRLEEGEDKKNIWNSFSKCHS